MSSNSLHRTDRTGRDWLRFVIVALIAVSPRPMAGASTGENIAFGKPYKVTPSPNYDLTQDAADATQLTDGNYTAKLSKFWTQKTTVGWQNTTTVVITVDLQSVRRIGGASINMAAGAADVRWPRAVHVLIG